jgi:hypothetical protein
VLPALPQVFLPSSGSTPRPSSVYPLEYPLTEIRRLQHTRYYPSKVAEELGCEVRPLYRSTIPTGCPCERDERGNLWIVGDRFRDWMLSVHGILTSAQIRRILWTSSHNVAKKPCGSGQIEAATKTVGRPGGHDSVQGPPAVPAMDALAL